MFVPVATFAANGVDNEDEVVAPRVGSGKESPREPVAVVGLRWSAPGVLQREMFFAVEAGWVVPGAGNGARRASLFPSVAGCVPATDNESDAAPTLALAACESVTGRIPSGSERVVSPAGLTRDASGSPRREEGEFRDSSAATAPSSRRELPEDILVDFSLVAFDGELLEPPDPAWALDEMG
jgi:hypothetical protein